MVSTAITWVLGMYAIAAVISFLVSFLIVGLYRLLRITQRKAGE